MTDEDRAVIDELIRLSPEAFGFPDMRWLADELISFVKEHGLVQGIDREYITARLREHRHRNSFRLKLIDNEPGNLAGALVLISEDCR